MILRVVEKMKVPSDTWIALTVNNGMGVDHKEERQWGLPEAEGKGTHLLYVFLLPGHSPCIISTCIISLHPHITGLSCSINLVGKYCGNSLIFPSNRRVLTY